MPTTVALTGTSGFIGQTLARRLCQEGLNVRGLIRSSRNLSSLEHPNLTLVPGNLDQIDSLQKLIQGCTSLIHCAGAIRGIEKKDFLPSNVQGLPISSKSAFLNPPLHESSIFPPSPPENLHSPPMPGVNEKENSAFKGMEVR